MSSNLTEQQSEAREIAPARAQMQAARGRQRVTNIVRYLVLVLAAALSIAPILLSIIGSLKSQRQFVSGSPLELPVPPTLENFVTLFTQTNFAYSMLVTIGVVLITTAGQLFTSILAAYAFARLRFWGREAIFWLYLSTMMIPAAVTLIPLFLLMSKWGMKNTFWGIVLPFAFISPYAVFLLRQFFMGLSQDILDAAKLDGASQWQLLWRILVPNARPIIVTLAIITLVSHWNNFLWPLMIASGKKTRTMTVAIAQLQSAHDGQWWLVMAATTVSLVPLIIVLSVFHKQLLRSITISRVGN
jgi:multiple sugar transport system permease protein